MILVSLNIGSTILFCPVGFLHLHMKFPETSACLLSPLDPELPLSSLPTDSWVGLVQVPEGGSDQPSLSPHARPSSELSSSL